MCLSHSSSFRSGKSVRNWAPRLSLRCERADARALGAVEHVAELERAEDVLVEDRAAVVDVGALGLLLEPLDDLERLLRSPRRRGRRRRSGPSSAPSSLADLRDAAAGAALAADDRVDLAPRSSASTDARTRRWLRSPWRGSAACIAGAAAEDQRVEQRVGAEPVAAVDRDAGAPRRRRRGRGSWSRRRMSVLTPPIV